MFAQNCAKERDDSEQNHKGLLPRALLNGESCILAQTGEPLRPVVGLFPFRWAGSTSSNTKRPTYLLGSSLRLLSLLPSASVS